VGTVLNENISRLGSYEENDEEVEENFKLRVLNRLFTNELLTEWPVSSPLSMLFSSLFLVGDRNVNSLIK